MKQAFLTSRISPHEAQSRGTTRRRVVFLIERRRRKKCEDEEKKKRGEGDERARKRKGREGAHVETSQAAPTMNFTNDGGSCAGSRGRGARFLEGYRDSASRAATASEPSNYSGRPCYVICHVVRFVSLSLSAV